MRIKNQTEPETPASGFTRIFVDSADNHLKTKDDAGVVVDLTTDPTQELPKTGQTTSYADYDDGYYQAGNSTSPRFTDNADGTVTDNVTGLMWVKQAELIIPGTSVIASNQIQVAKGDWIARRLSSVAVNSGGGGYAVDDVLTVVQEGGSLGTAKVLSVVEIIDTAILNAAGSGYNQDEILTVNQGNYDGTVTITSVNTTISSAILNGAGSGYSVDDILTVVQEGGSLGTVKVLSVNSTISSVTLRDAGSGYAENDVLTVVQSGGSLGTATVNSVDTGGEVLTITLTDVGSGYASADDLETTVSPSGGSGCTVDITVTREVLTIELVDAGSGYKSGSGLETTGGEGSGCTVDITSGEVLSISLTNAGTGYIADYNLETSGGTGSGCTVDITTSGVVSTIELVDVGSGYTDASGLETTVSPEGGSGCTIDITAGYSVGDLVSRDGSDAAPFFVCVTANNDASWTAENWRETVWRANASDISTQTQAMTWADAITNCEALDYAGYTDWRMPNINEVTSIVNYSAYGSTTYAEFPNTYGIYWSGSSDSDDPGDAWVIVFNSAGNSRLSKSSGSVRVRPVRGGI